MEEDFFKVGYTSYLSKIKKEKPKRTSLLNKLFKHKIILFSLGIIVLCVAMNLWLIYRFINILHIL